MTEAAPKQPDKILRQAAIQARRKLYAATQEIDRLLTSREPDAGEKLRPLIEAARAIPG